EPVALSLPRPIPCRLRLLLCLPRRAEPCHELSARGGNGGGASGRPRELRLRRGRPAPLALAAQHASLRNRLPRRADPGVAGPCPARGAGAPALATTAPLRLLQHPSRRRRLCGGTLLGHALRP